MRVKELSSRSGVSVPTIKYYLREGLLPAGELVSRNQAIYSDAHLRRLRLIRALIDIGGLTIAAVRDVLAAADTPDETVRRILYTAQESISAQPDLPRDEAWAEAERNLADLVERRGWRVNPDSRAWQTVVAVLVSARQLEHGVWTRKLDVYAEACERLASADLDYVAGIADVDAMLEGVVVGTVLGDTLVTALRRLAHQSESARRLGDDAPGADA
ncbi:MerR family transcriptional regulator [Actinophytocola glycyrrhizae]|uniref:MerR family transcriptional regulator n=1 Tax=Actinophytocola glycyrrhizae TaxID=2044873 RepID=A0ABV9S1G8_9PSEU